MKSRFLSVEWCIWLVGCLGLCAAGAVSCGDGSESAPSDAAGGGGPTNEAGASATAGATATATCTNDAATADNTEEVVDAANALIDALTSEQQETILLDKTLANAEQWSNLPTTFVARNGVKIGDMSAEAQDAAVKLASVAAGTTGATLLSELRAADQFLVTDGKASATDYGSGLYYFSIHGTPATDTAWMLQIAGHHLAYNFTYAGRCTSATPFFDAVEPTTWTDSEAVEHAPLEAQRAAVVELLASIASVSGAKLSGTYSDLINGPVGGGPGGSAGGDTKYPSQLVYPTGTAGRGVNVASLSSAQVALVKTAMEAWVKNVANPVSSALFAEYESDDALAQTYVGYAGSTELTSTGAYFRIDGPRIWIELTVQGGIVYRNRVHYHTIWRDKVADYGAEYASQ